MWPSWRIGLTLLMFLSLVLMPGSPAQAGAAPGHIVFDRSSGRHFGYFLMNPNGSDQHQVLDLSGKDWAFGGLDLSDAGSELALTLLPRNDGRIYLVNSDGSDFHRLTSGGDDSDPSFSPNGHRLVFTRYANGHDILYRIATDGSGLKRLTGPSEPQAAFPSWSPDGSMIAFVAYGRARQRLVVTDRTGTWFRFVFSRPRDAGQIFTTTWSPDSSTIAFGMYSPHYNNADLWTVGANGNHLTQITDTPQIVEVNPSYAPDGSRLACIVSDPYGRHSDVLVMDPDGTDRYRFATTGTESILSWGG